MGSSAAEVSARCSASALRIGSRERHRIACRLLSGCSVRLVTVPARVTLPSRTGNAGSTEVRVMLSGDGGSAAWAGSAVAATARPPSTAASPIASTRAARTAYPLLTTTS